MVTRIPETVPAIRSAIARLLCMARLDLAATLASGKVVRVHDRRLAIMRRAWLAAVDRAESCQRKLDRARVDRTRDRWRYAVAVWQSAAYALATMIED